MITLPKTKTPAPAVVEPKRLFIFSHPKIGKTSNLAQLPNSLLIDLEDGAEAYESASINVRKVALQHTNNDLLAALMLIKDQLLKENTEAKKQVYDFVIIDTTTAMENLARGLALSMYKSSNAGSKFKGTDVVTELEYGAGYEWLRNAFVRIYNAFQATAGKCLILSGHVKFSSINKDGKNLQANDVQLTGKLKQIVCSDADAIGFMYRKIVKNEDGTEKTLQNILSFKTNELDLATGARSEHLANQEFVISEKEGKGKVITHWDLIFPSIKTQK
jgi:hypothetical protein